MATTVQHKEEAPRPTCRYILAGSTCPRGLSCQFPHAAPRGAMGTNAARAPVTKPANQAQPLLSLPPEEVKALSAEDRYAMQQAEVQQIKKVYSESYVLKSRPPLNSGKPTVFALAFQPTDPDFPFELDHLWLQISLPPAYPNEPCSFSILQGTAAVEAAAMAVRGSNSGGKMFTPAKQAPLPEEIVQRIERNLNNAARVRAHTPMIRPLLTYLDRNLESFLVLQPATTPATSSTTSSSQTFKFVSFSPPKSQEADKKANAPSERTKDPKEVVVVLKKGSTRDDPQAYRLGAEAVTASTGSTKSKSTEVTPESSSTSLNNFKLDPVLGEDTPYDGIHIRMIDLELIGCDFADAHLLHISGRCDRCKAFADLECPAKKEVATGCQRCGQVFLVRFRPILLHGRNDAAGFLDVEGWTPLELIAHECCFYLSCDNCDTTKSLKEEYKDAEASYVKQEFRGVSHVHERRCRDCFNRVALAFRGVKFVQLAPSSVAFGAEIRERGQAAVLTLRQAIKQKERDEREIGVVPGHPLPDHGTCSHYKKSKRWLRFPCCKRLFPCDICHDETSDHPMEYAHRMVCGFCSREQPIPSDSICTFCSHATTYRAGGVGGHGFWEGGNGCRDPTLMNRKDKHKTRGLGKTHSRKAQAAGSH